MKENEGDTAMEFKVGDEIKLKHWKGWCTIYAIDSEDKHNGLKLECIVNDEKYTGEYPFVQPVYKWIKKEKEPMKQKIDMSKKYRKIGTHEPVRVICVDRVTEDDRIPVMALIKHSNGIEESWYLTATGCSPCGVQIIEEIPAVDWSKVEVDTPMWIRTFGEGPWHKRHFHKVGGGRVHYWPNGCTLFTCNGTSDINSDKPENCSLEEPK